MSTWADAMRQARKHRIFDVIVGGAVGTVVGAVVAVNVMITFGTDAGYEATLPELIRDKPVVAVIVLVTLVAGPVMGVFIARRIRNQGDR